MKTLCALLVLSLLPAVFGCSGSSSDGPGAKTDFICSLYLAECENYFGHPNDVQVDQLKKVGCVMGVACPKTLTDEMCADNPVNNGVAGVCETDAAGVCENAYGAILPGVERVDIVFYKTDMSDQCSKLGGNWDPKYDPSAL